MTITNLTWLQIRSGYAHLVFSRYGDKVEFYCGKARNDADLVLPKATARFCPHCLSYVRKLN